MNLYYSVGIIYCYWNYLRQIMAEGNRAPYFHSELARSVYLRIMNDERLRNMDFSKFYKVDELALTDAVREKFVEMTLDNDTQLFLDQSFEQSDWVFTQIWHSIAKSFLGIFMTQTSVNGLLRRGRMFVWSREQAEFLLQELTENSEGSCTRRTEQVAEDACRISISDPSGTAEPKRLLDLGAGDGYVTQVTAHLVDEVHVTEASPVMRKILRGLGYKVLDTWKWAEESKDISYNVICCLNLLDRCDTPISLLSDIHQRLAPDGILVIALVLPFNPYVEFGSSDHEPSEAMNIEGTSLEEQVNSLTENVFPKLGFSLRRWTKLPYLCEGDLDQSFYWLTDIVFVLNKITHGVSSQS